MSRVDISAEALELKRAYNRKVTYRWREKNKEKYNRYQREYQRAYRERNAERIKQCRLEFFERQVTELKQKEREAK